MAVRLLVVAGGGAGDGVTRLLADQRVQLVDTPRHADVMAVVGAIPTELGPALRAVHDQLAHPRAVRWWTSEQASLPGLDGAGLVTVADPVPALAEAADDAPQPLVQPDEPPTEWRGVGPYGTGGEGMMGGTPYGRSMTMTGDDLRDGLALDRLSLVLGPLLSPLPTGLTLEVTLQGDVLVEVDVRDSIFASDPATWRGAAPPGDPDVATGRRGAVADGRTGEGEVRVADIELARARHHLGAVARTLRLAGLDALARRTARLAVTVTADDGRAVRRLHRWLRRTTAVRWLLSGVGRVDADVAGAGVVARAAGAAVDARSDDATYTELGFSVVTHRAGDAEARLHQRLAEAAHALDLAGAAGDRRTQIGAVEGPDGPVRDRGAVVARLHAALPRLLLGMEWGDAVTTIDSLALDLAHAARARRGAAV